MSERGGAVALAVLRGPEVEAPAPDRLCLASCACAFSLRTVFDDPLSPAAILIELAALTAFGAAATVLAGATALFWRLENGGADT